MSSAFLHMDYWPGNILWHKGQISALVDWDAASYGDPALDVAYFRMNMYIRGIKEAADMFLDQYEAESGTRGKSGLLGVGLCRPPIARTRDLGRPYVRRGAPDTRA